MPFDEIRMFDYFDGLDASGVEQGDGIPGTDVVDGSDYAADVCTNFDDAFHILDFAQTFDGGFDRFTVRFNEVEFSFVPSNLFCITLSNDFFQIILSNKTQNGNRICFIIQGLKVVAKEIGTEEGRSKILGDVMH